MVAGLMVTLYLASNGCSHIGMRDDDRGETVDEVVAVVAEADDVA